MASGDSEQEQTKCRPKNPCVLIRNLVDLMEHPMSENATERHLQILNDFINATIYAFWLPDVPYIIRLYEAIIRKIKAIPAFQKPLESLLHFSAVPPMLTKAFDKVEYARDLQEYFSVLGYLILCSPDESLSALVFTAITNLLERKSPVGFCCVPLESCKLAAEKSHLPEILAQLLQVISENLYPKLLDLMFMICGISTYACSQKIVEENALEYLLQRLEPTWRQRNLDTKPKNPSSRDNIPNFDDTCCILWKLLNAMDKEKGNVKNPTIYALWSLQYAFRWANIRPGHRVARNNVSAIILKIFDNFPTCDFVTSDLAEDVTVLAMTVGGCDCRSNLKFTEDELDFYFKKIIWACLHYFTQSSYAEIIKSSRIVKVFTKFLFKEPTTKDHMEQHCDLMRIVLRIIPKYLYDSVDDFLHLQGPLKMIKMIEDYLQKAFDIEILEALLYCLSEILFLEIDDIVMDLGENDASNIMISVCAKILNIKTLKYVHQKCLARSFCILRILCTSGYMTDRAILGLCADYFNRVIHPNEDDPVLDARVTACAIDLLWESMLCINKLHDEFLHKGGIYLMLDVTEMCTFPVKALSLGVLADVAKQSSCVPYLITWRKRGRKLMSVLMEIFRGETEIQCDSSEKTHSSSQKEDNKWLNLCHRQQITFENSCVAKNDLLLSCRNKIHALLNALKVQYKDNVDIANESYKLYNEKLSTDDELTMLFAENFVSLKMCEAWMNVAKDLEREGIVPVEIDNEYLIDKVQRIHQWKSYLQYEIERIIKNEMQSEHYNELETYVILKEARLSDALDALQELRYISNCTERMFQVRKKIRLSREVVSIQSQNANYHRTVCNLPFTNIYNQKLDVQSDIICDTNEETFEVTPVSLDDEESLEFNDLEDDLLPEPNLEC